MSRTAVPVSTSKISVYIQKNSKGRDVVFFCMRKYCITDFIAPTIWVDGLLGMPL